VKFNYDHQRQYIIFCGTEVRTTPCQPVTLHKYNHKINWEFRWLFLQCKLKQPLWYKHIWRERIFKSVIAIIILHAGYAGEGEVRQLHQGRCHSNRLLVLTYIPGYKNVKIKKKGLCIRYPLKPAKLATSDKHIDFTARCSSVHI
jgi:hypothetical protein